MPKVLRIINRLNLGGPTFNAALLTRYLSPEFETLLVSGVKESSEESSDFIVKDLGLDYIELPEMGRSINPLNDFLAYRELIRIIRRFKPDIVHTHAAKAGALGRLAAFHEHVPVTVHTFHGHVFHSYFNPVKTRFYLSIERYLAKRSSAIVAISDLQKHELADVYKLCEAEKIKVIPLGFDLSRFRENKEEKRRKFRSQFFLEEDEIAVGIIGRLVPVKNHPLFLNAAKQILERTRKKVRFFIVGDGEALEDLLNLSRQLGLQHTYFPANPIKTSVTFCSWMRDADVAVSGLDIIALTSFNEGTPVSLIEAQAGNKPVVTTNVGGIGNIVVPGETALLVDNNDSDAFVKAILELTENDELRKRMSVAGWEHVQNRFHYTRLVSETSKLYFELLNRRFG